MHASVLYVDKPKFTLRWHSVVNWSTFFRVALSRDANSIALLILLVNDAVFAAQVVFHPSPAKDAVLKQRTPAVNNNLSFIISLRLHKIANINIEVLKLKGLYFERLQITSEYFEISLYRYPNQLGLFSPVICRKD